VVERSKMPPVVPQMKEFSILWRFVFEADEQATAQAAADEVARRLGLADLPPVKSYKEVDWWITDIVVHASDKSLAVLLGRQLALAGRLAHKWSLEAISELDEDGMCFAIFNAGEQNEPKVAGLHWALLEVWVRQDRAGA
jgi:hypothetical protein